ncbi:MAG: radical SAM protein [Candidatus Omnitrophica bacterium]|nr:radical SAM protein [Candidatus Omnitrophota bacterium]
MVKRFLLRTPVPVSVVFALTYKCQCNCVHCSVGDYNKFGNTLSTKEIKETIDFIARWGPIKITFFGGEPLLRKDILDIVKYASGKGLRVSVDTNGICLDKAMVVSLKRARVSNINVSIDSVNAEIHDTLRRSPGCFGKAIEGLELCVKHNIPCLISTYASKGAIKRKDLEGIVRLGKRIGVSGVKILFPILSGKWRKAEEERLDPEEEDYIKSLIDPSFVYLEDALEMLKSSGKGCSALRRNLIYISPYGDIQPCPAIPISFGNIRSENIRKIVVRMTRHDFFRKYASCKGCLMNAKGFRVKYFLKANEAGLPLYVDKF